MRSTRSRSWTERLLGSGPIAAPPHVLALREDALVYVRVERRVDGALQVLRHLAAAPGTSFGRGPLGGPPADPEAFAAATRDLLERAGGRIEEATLVLPDRWLRLVFTEFTELPSAAAAREDALRFKLRQMVPFRADELRVQATEVAPLPGQEEPRRLAIAFALESLLGAVERALESLGVRIGVVTSEALALASALDARQVALLALVEDVSYTLLVARDGEPLLCRLKELGPSESHAGVRRELLLTRTFLEERLPDHRLGSIFVAAADADTWARSVEEAFEAPCVVVDSSCLRAPVGELPPGFRFDRAGALLGAALLEVA